MIREAWEQGKGAAQLGRQFDVPAATIRTRRRREGWTRITQLERPSAPAPVTVDALTIAESALARALDCLLLGRAAEAMAMIKAGDAVGAFADFVGRLRAEATAAPAAGPTSAVSPAS